MYHTKKEYTQLEYPFTFKASSNMVAELHGAEYGSYEDAVGGRNDHNPADHIVAVIERRKAKSGITVHNFDQLHHLEYALRTGTVNHYVSERAMDTLESAVARGMAGVEVYPVAKEKEDTRLRTTSEQWRDACDEVIAMATDLKLIQRPAAFKREINIKVIRGEGGHGGLVNGKPLAEIGRYAVEARPKKFNEYARIKDDKEIGTFLTTDPNDVLMVIAMHEVAHAIDWWNNPSTKGHDAHGSDWRVLYRAIRYNFGFVRGADGYLLSKAA